MKALLALAFGTVILLATGVSSAQNGNMMSGGGGGGWMGGDGGGWMSGSGYGGIWVPILLVIVIVGLVGWIVTQKRK
jgi:hypothetical protein